MPTPEDGTLELDTPLPAVGSDSPGDTEDSGMDEAYAKLLAGQLAQTGNVAQNNFVTTQKALDYDFMENKRIVTLDEAVGVREVASKSVPAGPTVG